MKPSQHIDLERLLQGFSSEEAAIDYFNRQLNVNDPRLMTTADFLQQLVQKRTRPSGSTYADAQAQALYDGRKLVAIADRHGFKELALKMLEEFYPREAAKRRKAAFTEEAQQQHAQSPRDYMQALYASGYVDEAIRAAGKEAQEVTLLLYLAELSATLPTTTPELEKIVETMREERREKSERNEQKKDTGTEQLETALTGLYVRLLERHIGQKRFERALSLCREAVKEGISLPSSHTIPEIKKAAVEYLLTRQWETGIPYDYRCRDYLHRAVSIERHYGTPETLKEVVNQAIPRLEHYKTELEQEEKNDTHGSYCDRESCGEMGPLDCSCGLEERSRKREEEMREVELELGVWRRLSEPEPPKKGEPAAAGVPTIEERIEKVRCQVSPASYNPKASYHPQSRQAVFSDQRLEIIRAYQYLRDYDAQQAAELRPALKQFFADYQDFHTVGNLEWEEGNLEQAITAYERDLQIIGDTSVWFSIAEVEKQRGNPARYQKIYRESLTLFERQNSTEYGRLLDFAEKAELPDKIQHYRWLVELGKPAL